VSADSPDVSSTWRSFAGGIRRYGFAKNGVDHDPVEAERIRWCAQQVLAGRTVASLVRELDAQGVKPVKAARWSSTALSDLLISPRIAGPRTRHGEVVGKAVWEPIVDLDTHELVKAAVAARGRGLTQAALSNWCNRILFCGRCGHAPAGDSGGPGRPNTYWCNTSRSGCGKVSILATKRQRWSGRCSPSSPPTLRDSP
jgi:site-specific DNA recombinase